MRTTIDLPEELHRAAVALARDRHQSLSRTVTDLLRLAMASPAETGGDAVSRRPDGFPVVLTDRRITADDVRGLDDDE
jgi:hypothetical protein